jgi:S-adenosylmethionine:tRNA ribosyltransferase-isomerase
MKTTDFSFELPEGLIAQHPPAERGRSRLMVLDRKTGRREHRMAADLPEILAGPVFRGKTGEPPLLVFNDSRVRKARLLGWSLKAGTGGPVEFLLVKRLDDRTWETMTRRAKRRRTGDRFVFAQGSAGERAAEIAGEDGESGPAGEFRRLRFDRPIDEDWLEAHGHIPLPPYIKRGDTEEDAERYQTIYARKTGSAAAPTAGLHFTREIMDELRRRGIETAFLTLHVGLGTFLPVRTEDIEDHLMHEEFFSIGEETARAVERARAEGRRVIAVGTTSLRTLESAWETGEGGHLRRGEGSTRAFIYPGYTFRAVEGLFTNFHTPQSTLLMLVSAFAGRELILESYAEAVRGGYRFFSYGDAMLIM